MAVLGLTKLQAVNRILHSIDIASVTALDTSGSSEATEAEEILDRANTLVQSWGWQDNLTLARTYSHSGGTITLAADTLWVRSAGTDQHRNLVLNGDALYDADGDTATFSANVALDRIRELTFVNCSPKLKELIAAWARLISHRQKRADSVRDAMYRQEFAQIMSMMERPRQAPLLPDVNTLLSLTVSQGATESDRRR